ncbi:MAG: sugar transporter, partial [Flavobacteriaceae bacterium]|nr:sugar transporter [Flavobacteriaceae bacterium]
MNTEEFHISNNPNAFFDIKGLLIKMSSYWYVFVLSIIIALGIAHRHNIRKQSIYGMETLISIKDDQNPFFTTNTSLTFNWGGTTDKVNTA